MRATASRRSASRSAGALTALPRLEIGRERASSRSPLDQVREPEVRMLVERASVSSRARRRLLLSISA